jgi:hypothetical protein
VCWNLCSRVALFLAVLWAWTPAIAQQSPPPTAPSPETVQKILDRLDSLEKQNAELLNEIHSLRQELAGTPKTPPLEERVEAVEQRTAEQAQTKVGTSQRFPISLTGMFLFDATDTNRSAYPDSQGTGASLRQSIIGLEFYGPHIFGDGQIHGSLAMDFFAGTSDNVLRIRRGVVSFDWRRRSITFGQDKPLIAPLQPTSFAHVGVPPLAGAGNLWLWLPQAEYEERIPLGANSLLKAQAEVIQTNESYNSTTVLPYQAGLAAYRPGAEARLEYQLSSNDEPRFTLGVGGHASTTHLYGQSIPSRVVSTDFKYRAEHWLEFSGSLLHGENFGNLGGLSPGISVGEFGAVPIRASAGWAQVALPVTNRLTFDFYAGRQLNAAADLTTNDPFRSLVYAGNVLYRIAPSVVLGFEGGHTQVTYWNALPFSARQFDATIAYLF